MSRAARILLVDDDVSIQRAVAPLLRSRGYHVDVVSTGVEAVKAVVDAGPDLIVLDLGLPDLEGAEVCRRVRAHTKAPIVILSARSGEAEKVAALDIGADDYVTKPFGPEELLARIRAVLRRARHTGNTKSSVVEVAGLRLNSQTREVWLDDDPIGLTSIEFDILDLLARSSGRIVSRDELTAALYQRESTPYERSLDVHMSHLRKKLERGGRSLIRTVRGVGYLFSSGSDETE